MRLSKEPKVRHSGCAKNRIHFSNFASSILSSLVDHACSSMPSSSHASANSKISQPHVIEVTLILCTCFRMQFPALRLLYLFDQGCHIEF